MRESTQQVIRDLAEAHIQARLSVIAERSGDFRTDRQALLEASTLRLRFIERNEGLPEGILNVPGLNEIRTLLEDPDGD